MHQGQPIEPRLHIFAMRLSYRLVGIIEAAIRPEEIHAAATEFYRAIVDDLRDYERKNGR
jgi:hypothetical protein